MSLNGPNRFKMCNSPKTLVCLTLLMKLRLWYWIVSCKLTTTFTEWVTIGSQVLQVTWQQTTTSWPAPSPTIPVKSLVKNQLIHHHCSTTNYSIALDENAMELQYPRKVHEKNFTSYWNRVKTGKLKSVYLLNGWSYNFLVSG